MPLPMGVRDFLTFFDFGSGVRAPTDLHAKWLKRRVFMQGCAFCSKNRYFFIHLISRPPKGPNFANFWTWKIFGSIWPLRSRREHPLSLSEPNESDIVNRQSGGEKLKYVLKFYIGDTCHVISRMRNDDLAFCLWAHEVSGTISRNPLEIETRIQWKTNRKWHIGIRMVTWLMTSRDPERSTSWPQYIWGPLSWQQHIYIYTDWCQWSTYRKWLPGNQMVTWPMTSRDSERSRSWHQYA